MTDDLKEFLKEATPIRIEIDPKHEDMLAKCILVVQFNDTFPGRVAWGIWQHLSDKTRNETNLTKALKPGSVLFIPPGMTLGIIKPNGEMETLNSGPDDKKEVC